MPETGQSEWNAQALVAAGAVLLLLTALWLGVYAPGQKKLSDDFETTYEYGGELKVLDLAQFQTIQDTDGDGCSCTVYPNAIARHVLVADSGQSSDDETFYNENFSVFGDDKTVDQDKDGLSDSYLFTLKDGNSWLDRLTYESRGEGSEADDYSYSTWNPNHAPTKENFQFPNPFVGTHTNTYVYQAGGDTEIDGVSAYVYVADETLTPIPYTPGSSNPLYGLMALGATFHISYHETVTIDATHGTALDRVFDVKVYANFPNFFAEGGLLYLTDGVHFPSETSYSGSLFDAANSLDVDVTAVKTTSAVTAMPGPDNSTVDPTTATHLLTNTAFAVNTDMVVGVDGNGTPIVVTMDLNADGSLVAPATMFVDRSTHQVGDGMNFSDTFPHMNTNVSAPAFFPNPFDSSYNNMYSPVGFNATTGIAHFRGVPIGVAGVDSDGAPILAPVQISSGTLWVYIEMNMSSGAPTGESIQTPDPLPDAMLAANGGSWVLHPTTPSFPILMDYTEDVYFDPFSGTVQNQVYNVTVYVDLDGTGNLTQWDSVAQTVDVEYTDEQKAAYASSMGQKAFAMYYSGKTIPVMTLDGGFTTDEKAEGVESAEERLSGLKLLDTYVPGLLIVLALGCLIGGFYLYYQEGEGGGGVAAPPAPEPEADDGGDDDTGDSADDDSGGDDADDGGDSDD